MLCVLKEEVAWLPMIYVLKKSGKCCGFKMFLCYSKGEQDWQDCQSLARAKILIGKPIKT